MTPNLRARSEEMAKDAVIARNPCGFCNNGSCLSCEDEIRDLAAFARLAMREALEAGAERCREVRDQPRNTGEDARSGYDGYRLGSGTCAGQLSALKAELEGK